jgi:hypothetical protein
MRFGNNLFFDGLHPIGVRVSSRLSYVNLTIISPRFAPNMREGLNLFVFTKFVNPNLMFSRNHSWALKRADPSTTNFRKN